MRLLILFVAWQVEIKRAKAMLADPTITAEEVAQQLGGSHRRSTGTYQAVAAS